MRCSFLMTTIIAGLSTLAVAAQAGQAPGPASAADIPISRHDRVYAAE